MTVKFKLHTFESGSERLVAWANPVGKSRAHSVTKFINSKDDILPVSSVS